MKTKPKKPVVPPLQKHHFWGQSGQLTMFVERDSLADDLWYSLEREHQRNGRGRNPCRDWYPPVPIVGSMPPHDADWLARQLCSLLESLPERAAYHREQAAAEARRARVSGVPMVLRSAGHALRWWTRDKRLVTDLRTVTRRRLELSLRDDRSYDHYAPCAGRKWGLGGALRRYTPWLCDSVWDALPGRVRDAVMRATARLPPCISELMHPVAIWWNLAPTHALRRLGLDGS